MPSIAQRNLQKKIIMFPPVMLVQTKAPSLFHLVCAQAWEKQASPSQLDKEPVLVQKT